MTKIPPEHSSFSRMVLEILKNIPSGKTMSYKQVATLAGNAKAARAVARIVASNYNPNIPCHRVIRSDGSVGGYNRGGEAKKQRLLKYEYCSR